MATSSKTKAAPKAALVAAPKTEVVGGAAMELLRQHALRGRSQLAKIPAGGVGVSFRGGAITIGGTKVGNSLRIIPLFPQFERTYYDRDFSVDDKSPPPCYSFDGVKPHEKSSEPQSESCERCEWNQWKSDKRQRGKACKEGMRLAFLRADKTLTAEDVQVAPVLMAKFSVMNSKIVGPVLDQLYETVGHPAAMLCDMTAEPDEATQIRNDLLPHVEVPPGLQAAVIARLDEAERLATQPYPDPEEKPAAPAAKKAPQRVRKF